MTALGFATPIPENEALRVSTLHGYEILDTPTEEQFDRIARIAVASLKVPMAFITFIEGDRVWFKSAVGIEIEVCDREGSFCGQTINHSGPMIVKDATRDPRFMNNPFVVPEGGIRAYAGAPLRASVGVNLGTLCIFDTVPRDFGPEEQQLLSDLAAMVVDELELRQASRRAVTDREERLADIATHLPGIVFQYMIDADRVPRFTYVSPAVSDLLGVEAGQILADPRAWLARVHPDDLAGIEATTAASYQALESWHWEGRCRKPSEQYGWFRGASVPRRLPDGAVVWNGFMLDITQEKRVELGLRQAQKMEAVGQLTGGIAHDFNNLLAIIQGNAEMLTHRVGEDDLLEAITRSARRGAEMTERLLAFSRRQQLDPRSIDPGDIITSMNALLSRTLGETIDVSIERSAALWPAVADPGQLENAILNLALNARDAMPGGGRLAIRCRNIHCDDNPACQDGKRSDFVVIEVSDDGEGMSTDIAARAFDPFYTTKEVGQGSGLGLSMVYGFAEQSGGFVLLDSTPGRGTTVRLHLPRSAEPSSPMDTARKDFAPAGGGETVLVIEDDADVRATLALMLDALDYRVREASTVAHAREVLADNGDIDLVLSDVVLPGGENGDQLADELRQTRPGLPVVLMSGYTREAVNRDADGRRLLNKPFSESALADALREALVG